MSKGSPQVILRLDEATLSLIDKELERQNSTRAAEPYTRSSWIRQAIAERLAKLERGRRPPRPVRPGRQPIIVSNDGGPADE